MFQHLQRFHFINEDKYLYKAFHEDIHLENINKNRWVNYIKYIIESCGLKNLFLNLIKSTTGEICKTDY